MKHVLETRVQTRTPGHQRTRGPEDLAPVAWTVFMEKLFSEKSVKIFTKFLFQDFDPDPHQSE